MTEHRATRKNAGKQTVYARMAARAVGQVKKDEGHGLVATSTYCAKAIEDDGDNQEAIGEEEDGVGTPGGDDDLDALEESSLVLFFYLSHVGLTLTAQRPQHGPASPLPRQSFLCSRRVDAAMGQSQILLLPWLRIVTSDATFLFNILTSTSPTDANLFHRSLLNPHHIISVYLSIPES